MIATIETVVFVLEVVGIYVLASLVRDFVKIKNEIEKIIDRGDFVSRKLR